MKCPKCGGEIPFYNLKPNCSHCGVNIMYFSQEKGLIRDAKRTELESAAARMVIARIKAAFIGSKAAIIRMVLTIAAIAILVLPIGSLHYKVPMYENSLSAGLIGVIQGFTSGILMKLPQFLSSTLFGGYTKVFLALETVFIVLLLLGLVILGIYILSFLRLEPLTRFMKNAALAGAVIALLGQIFIVVLAVAKPLPEAPYINFKFGWGGIAAAAIWFALFFINRYMLLAGIEPTYRENDLKRRELLHKVRAGEVSLDSLPLPVFESEEERAERMKALEEALKAEEEGKEL